jgi:sulfhydrogenase subunit beta (sulfur reductase)
VKARALAADDVLQVVDLLRADGYQVSAPFADPDGETAFEEVTDLNRTAVALHLRNPLFPPKRFALPPIEPLLEIEGHGASTRFRPTIQAPRVAVFGIRSCDLAGIGHLDRFYLGGAFRDPYYAARRGALLLVNVVCTAPGVDIGAACFCPCTDTGPAAREGFDLQLMDLSDGDWLAVAGTPRGEALLQAPFFRRGTPGHLERRRVLLEGLRSRFQTRTSWFAAAVARVSQGEVAEGTWEEIGRRCLECGGCTYVCPACTCFTVSDRPAGPDRTERVRIWDSCALSGFTRMAGGHNPRRAVHDRRNRRFYRKLSHFFVQRERSVACVGCGRCTEVCHGDVGMPEVVELLRRGPAPSPAPAAAPAAPGGRA